MHIIASADSITKIAIVVVVGVVVLAFIAWKVYAVAKAAKTKGSPEERQKAVGKALLGGGSTYGKGYDAGKKAGEQLASLFKRKPK